ncbi:YggT family protein [Fundidesulfovibrio terrae]|uniref:YggT family protein n=1 Tax=Fundidesulfovibrio terrae TaxID=2922866 RepID=UPI003C2D9E02
MPFVGPLLKTIALILDFVFGAYKWIIIIAAVVSWVRPDPYHPVIRFLYSVTEPVLYRVRRLMPFVMVGGMDLSPIVVILALQFIGQVFIVESLIQLAFMMR